MIIAGDRLLVLPMKCASRSVETSVRGRRPVSTRSHIDGVVRHTRVRDLSEEDRGDREVFCLIRDPFEWYPSIWAHMARQPFALRWVHSRTGSVPASFERALRAYMLPLEEEIRGDASEWLERNPSPSYVLPERPDAIALDQARAGVGWWSYVLCSSVEERDGTAAIEDGIRWIPVDAHLSDRLSDAGFDLRRGLPRIGAKGRSPIRWTDEMRSLVESYDRDLLRVFREHKVIDRA